MKRMRHTSHGEGGVESISVQRRMCVLRSSLMLAVAGGVWLLGSACLPASPCSDGSDCRANYACQGGICVDAARVAASSSGGASSSGSVASSSSSSGASSSTASSASGGTSSSMSATSTSSSSGSSGAPWWNAAWSHRIPLTVRDTGRTQALDDFPVLVLLSSARFAYADAAADASDLRFVDQDGTTMLSHQVDGWDTAGLSRVWVRVPLLEAASGHRIWMYYGNAAAPDASDAASVWNVRYTGVHHLGVDANDSSGNGYNGVEMGTTPTPGPFGTGRAFDGAGQYISLGTNLDIVRNVYGATLCTWLRTGDRASVEAVISIAVNNNGVSNAMSRALLELAPGDLVRGGARARDSHTQQLVSFADAQVTSGQWNHVCTVFDVLNDGCAIYLNGVAKDTKVCDFFGFVFSDSAAAVAAVGSEDDGSGLFFHGDLDELRISNTVRSPQWIRTEYDAMQDLLWDYGAAQTQ